METDKFLFCTLDSAAAMVKKLGQKRPIMTEDVMNYDVHFLILCFKDHCASPQNLKTR
jgi:hypothetical protein